MIMLWSFLIGLLLVLLFAVNLNALQFVVEMSIAVQGVLCSLSRMLTGHLKLVIELYCQHTILSDVCRYWLCIRCNILSSVCTLLLRTVLGVCCCPAVALSRLKTVRYVVANLTSGPCHGSGG